MSSLGLSSSLVIQLPRGSTWPRPDEPSEMSACFSQISRYILFLQFVLARLQVRFSLRSSYNRLLDEACVVVSSNPRVVRGCVLFFFHFLYFFIFIYLIFFTMASSCLANGAAWEIHMILFREFHNQRVDRRASGQRASSVTTLRR